MNGGELGWLCTIDDFTMGWDSEAIKGLSIERNGMNVVVLMRRVSSWDDFGSEYEE